VLEVINWGAPDGTDALIRNWANTYAKVLNAATVTFKIELWFTDLGTNGLDWDACGATFEWTLESSSNPSGPWSTLAGQLGSRHFDKGDGSGDTIRQTISLTGNVGEQDVRYFRLKVRCRSTDYRFTDHDSGQQIVGPFSVVRQQTGDFILDYLPVT